MANGPLAPGDEHALGRVEMLFDVLVPISSAADLCVPPDCEALSFERLNERFQPRAILSLVTTGTRPGPDMPFAPPANVAAPTLRPKAAD